MNNLQLFNSEQYLLGGTDNNIIGDFVMTENNGNTLCSKKIY